MVPRMKRRGTAVRRVLLQPPERSPQVSRGDYREVTVEFVCHSCYCEAVGVACIRSSPARRPQFLGDEVSAPACQGAGAMMLGGELCSCWVAVRPPVVRPPPGEQGVQPQPWGSLVGHPGPPLLLGLQGIVRICFGRRTYLIKTAFEHFHRAASGHP